MISTPHEIPDKLLRLMIGLGYLSVDPSVTPVKIAPYKQEVTLERLTDDNHTAMMLRFVAMMKNVDYERRLDMSYELHDGLFDDPECRTELVCVLPEEFLLSNHSPLTEAGKREFRDPMSKVSMFRREFVEYVQTISQMFDTIRMIKEGDIDGVLGQHYTLNELVAVLIHGGEMPKRSGPPSIELSGSPIKPEDLN